MAQERIEVILAKQLAGMLSVPIVLYNASGDIIFYNEAAEALTGFRFNETGRVARADRGMFRISDEDDRPLPIERGPAELALTERRPGQSRFFMRAPTSSPVTESSGVVVA
jgi:PAS domain-containing protein